MRVCRQPIRSTRPSICLSGERTNSPTLNGRSRWIIRPPNKLASRSLEAKPMAMPPMPPKASKPEMLNPMVCMTASTVTTTTEMRDILLRASTVERSTSSPACLLATTLLASSRISLNRNQAVQIMTAMSRADGMYSSNCSPVWRWIRCSAKEMPASQISTGSGLRAAATSESSQTFSVREATTSACCNRRSTTKCAATVATSTSNKRMISGLR